jgi:ATP-dependent DNA ligase
LSKIQTTNNNILLPDEVITVKPRYVAEVEYLKITPDKKLRVPVFKRLREDKKTAECRFPEQLRAQA